MKDHDKIREVAHELSKYTSSGVHTYGPCVSNTTSCSPARGSRKCRGCLKKELASLTSDALASEYWMSVRGLFHANEDLDLAKKIHNEMYQSLFAEES